MSLHFCPQQTLQLLHVCTALCNHQYTGPSQPSPQAWWAASESEQGILFALPPQPTAHLCCTAVQDAVIPAGQLVKNIMVPTSANFMHQPEWLFHKV